MKNSNHSKGLIGVAFAMLLSLLPLISSAQVYPLSENTWTNPEFVDRFLGSYGVLTGVEPKITSDEAGVMNEVAELFATDIPAVIRRLQSEITSETSAAFNYTLANVFLQQGDTDQAIRQYREAIKKFPNFQRAYKNAGLAYLQKNNYGEALKFLVKAVELGDNSGNTFGLLGYSHLNEGNFKSALDAYRMAVVMMPDNKDWKVGMAHAAMQAGRYDEAAELFKELIEKYPNQKEYHVNRANAFIYLGDPKTASKHLEIVKRQGKADGSLLALLGDVYLNEGVSALAATNYEAALNVQASPVGLDRGKRFVENLFYRASYDEAQKLADAVSAKFGNRMSNDQRAEFSNLMAQLKLAQGFDEEAAVLLEEVIRLDPTNGKALHILANFHWKKNEIEKAEHYFELAVADKEVERDVLIDHARMLVSERKYDLAVKLLRRALDLDYSDAVNNYLEAVRRALLNSR
jgi:tetratricopeptide (TPR) repeat protein